VRGVYTRVVLIRLRSAVDAARGFHSGKCTPARTMRGAYDSFQLDTQRVV
jgi:hypothetical protein